MVYKNAKLPDGKVVDIEVIDGKIVAVDKELTSVKEIDLKEAYIVPKIVDLNVRLKDASLGASGIKELAKEAKKGGIGHCVVMPDTTPPLDNEVALEFAQNTIKDIQDVTIDLAINTLQEDLSLSNIAILLKKGACVPYMSTIAKNNIAIKIAEYVKMYKTTLFCKAEDNSLKLQGVMFEGDVSAKLGLAGIPELSEVVHVSRMIEIARYYDIAILFKAIASPRSLEMIDKAKKEGVQVQAEVSLHHLLFDDTACEDFNTTAKIDPPLMDTASQKALVAALKEGRIDTLTLLHQPSSPVNKEVAFFDAAYGSSALAEGWGLYYTKLVKSGVLSLSQLIELVVQKPLSLLGLPPKRLQRGADINDFVVLDIDRSSKIENSNSLYNGEEISVQVRELS